MSHNISSDTSALIVASEWLIGIFAAPLSQQQLTDASAAPGQDALRWVGAQLNAASVTEILCCTLDQATPEHLTVRLQRSYTMLFEGIFRDRAVLPYESAWCGASNTLGGTPVAAMNDILRDLNLHVSSHCCEPADHLAIELAALAAALRNDQSITAIDLVRRLNGWTPAFGAALQQQDRDGFYAAAGQLLLALMRAASVTLMAIEPSVAFVHEQRKGNFA